jgi:hypothetical protein
MAAWSTRSRADWFRKLNHHHHVPAVVPDRPLQHPVSVSFAKASVMPANGFYLPVSISAIAGAMFCRQ